MLSDIFVCFFYLKYFSLKYVVKVLMGAVDEWFDTLDERRVSSSGPSSRRSSKGNKKNSCSIL